MITNVINADQIPSKNLAFNHLINELSSSQTVAINTNDLKTASVLSFYRNAMFFFVLIMIYIIYLHKQNSILKQEVLVISANRYFLYPNTGFVLIKKFVIFT